MTKEFTETTLGLVAGRHDLPVADFIFGEGDITFPIDPEKLQELVRAKLASLGVTPQASALVVYVTGLTVATTAVIKVCLDDRFCLTLRHFDRETGGYFDDPIITRDLGDR